MKITTIPKKIPRLFLNNEAGNATTPTIKRNVGSSASQPFFKLMEKSGSLIILS